MSRNSTDISIVLCTYNRAELFRIALKSLVIQENISGFDFEIIIIDDGSKDYTKKLAKNFIKNNPTIKIRYIHLEGRGIAGARNVGIKEACGKWIAFFDDDQWAEPQWLCELYRVGENMEADCVAGVILLDIPNRSNTKITPFCRGLLGEKLFDSKIRKYSRRASFGLGSGNLMIRRTLFSRIGIFDEKILIGCEDADLVWRAILNGSEMWHVPNAVVHHIIPETRLQIEYFIYVSLRIGVADARLRHKYRGMLKCLIGLLRRILRNLGRYVLLFLKSIILKNESYSLEQVCRLYLTIGYVRGCLFFFAPKFFKQRKFFKNLNFRIHHS